MALNKDTENTPQNAPAETPEQEGSSAEASAKAALSAEALPKAGYKKTPLGWLPVEWEVVRLKKIIKKLEAGVSVNGEDRPLSKDEIGVLKVSAVSYGAFNPSEAKVVDEKELILGSEKKKETKYLLKYGALLTEGVDFDRKGEYGR
ncbi:MAG: hypothetical protein H6560_10390 [Lewinellaceae bacterium]|nr:hypothetical protein [Lewinellaceae bacterium]